MGGYENEKANLCFGLAQTKEKRIRNTVVLSAIGMCETANGEEVA